MDPVVLVVADPGDHGGRAAARAAAPLAGPGPAYVVSARELRAATWHHEVARDGRCTTLLGLPGRPVLGDADIGAVLCREPALVLPGTGDRDGAYAGAEWTALVVSWLASLGDRVVNAVEGTSPVGPAWSPRHWLLVAAEAGLPVALRGRTTGGRRSVLVAGHTVVGAGVDEVALHRLAQRSRCRLLEVVLDVDGFVVEVSPLPALRDPAQVAAAAGLLAWLAGTRQEVAA